MSAIRLPTYFISHGGGPWTHMKREVGSRYDLLEASLKALRTQFGDRPPRAVLVVSGHWEERDFAVMASERPPMIYDYGGFPEHTYRIRYDAPGAPDIAARVGELLAAAGLATHQDAERGFDHGTFVPMYAIWPQAEVPILQMSIRRDYDPEAHLAAGRALAPLRDEDVLIVGSGLSYHNLRAFGPAGGPASHAFDAWLQRTLASPPAERGRALLAWSQAPGARAAHPREDHLVPLMVAVGAAEHEPATCVYHEDAFGGSLSVSSFRFGAEAEPRARAATVRETASQLA